MQIKTLDEVKSILLQQDRFLILTHTKPDGDALGSSYTLLKFLLNHGKQAFIGLEEEIFYKYKSFFPLEDMNTYVKYYHNIKSTDYDFIVVLDTSSYNLLGLFKNTVLDNPENTIILDHHVLHKPLDIKHYVKTISSTAEILFDLIGIENIDENMAKALYMGLVFDTGQFRHSSANEEVFFKVAKLLEKYSINLEDTYYYLFENETLGRKQLIAELSNHIEFYAQGKIAVCYFSLEVISILKKKGIHLSEDDMIDLTGVPHSLKGVQISVMIREKQDQTTFSFRSRCDFNLADFVSTYGGGGHKKAAGLKLSRTPYQNIKDDILMPLEKSFLEC